MNLYVEDNKQLTMKGGVYQTSTLDVLDCVEVFNIGDHIILFNTSCRIALVKTLSSLVIECRNSCFDITTILLGCEMRVEWIVLWHRFPSLSTYVHLRAAASSSGVAPVKSELKQATEQTR
eukprot:scaffold101589_cov36-Cyclotella_meneghiniana.AAC.4